MFQKLRPIDEGAATATPATDATATQNTPPQTLTTSTESSAMSDTTSTNTTSSSTDVELDGLTRNAANPATSYSPRPATSGFASYPMARPATGGYATPGSETQTASQGRKLVISEGINISGEIDACNHLVVEGQVEASLKGANILDISESGVFFGSVEINECTIAGRFEGDLKVDGRLTVRSSGVIIGSLSYRELAVEAGATIEGKITPMNSKAPSRTASATTTTSKPTTSSTSAPAKRPSDNSNELPFATKAAS